MLRKGRKRGPHTHGVCPRLCPQGPSTGHEQSSLMGTHGDQALQCSHALRLPPLLSLQQPPRDPLSITSWGQGGGRGAFWRVSLGRESKGTSEQLEGADSRPPLPPSAPTTSLPLTPESRLGTRGAGGRPREGGTGTQRPAPSLMEGGHWGKFGEGENSELSTFLFLFFFLRNFFP